MTVAYGVRGITFNGTDLQPADQSMLLQIVRGLDELPEVRGSDSVVPGLAGEIPRNRVRGSLAIELAGWITVNGATEALRLAAYRAKVDALQALFNPTGIHTLVVTLESGATRSIEARPLTIVYGPEEIPGLRTISVALKAPSGLWA